MPIKSGATHLARSWTCGIIFLQIYEDIGMPCKKTRSALSEFGVARGSVSMYAISTLSATRTLLPVVASSAEILVFTAAMLKRNSSPVVCEINIIRSEFTCWLLPDTNKKDPSSLSPYIMRAGRTIWLIVFQEVKSMCRTRHRTIYPRNSQDLSMGLKSKQGFPWILSSFTISQIRKESR